MKSPYVGVGVGLWYVVAPFVWGYALPFLVWQDVVIGATIIALCLSFALSPGRLTGWMLIGVGAYSMFAPFLHDYLVYAQPLFNDLVFGVVTVGVGAAIGGAGLEYAGEETA